MALWTATPYYQMGLNGKILAIAPPELGLAAS